MIRPLESALTKGESMVRVTRATPALLLAVLLILGMPAMAAVVVNEDVPIDDVVFNPCTNEDVHITGTAHTVGTLTENGNRSNLSVHVNYRVEGVGLTSGDSYSSNAIGMANENVEFDNDEIGQATVVLHARLIGPGNLPDADELAFAHITVNPSGEATVEIVQDRLTCR
jgi:hypothetical protein